MTKAIRNVLVAAILGQSQSSDLVYQRRIVIFTHAYASMAFTSDVKLLDVFELSDLTLDKSSKK